MTKAGSDQPADRHAAPGARSVPESAGTGGSDPGERGDAGNPLAQNGAALHPLAEQRADAGRRGAEAPIDVAIANRLPKPIAGRRREINRKEYERRKLKIAVGCHHLPRVSAQADGTSSHGMALMTSTANARQFLHVDTALRSVLRSGPVRLEYRLRNQAAVAITLLRRDEARKIAATRLKDRYSDKCQKSLIRTLQITFSIYRTLNVT
ncbi:hypothetical protein [Burkholderia glumae]|uniref:hypothetical protein n=1 Tax=Burkholderia glumae TaxID=337 RepID=UPI00159333E0|nr:hypothetical protein [Burkholderia glumae]NVE25586.1 hypothetical protein [Burkholderia glumae]